MNENRLIQMKERYEFALGLTGTVVLDLDIATNNVIYSDSASDLFGLSSMGKGGISKYIAEGLVYEEDKEKYRQMFKDVLSTLGNIEEFIRLRRKDGNYYWHKYTVSALRNDAGMPIRIVGCIEDATSLKEAQTIISDAVAKDYDYLMLVDIEKDRYIRYITSGDENDLPMIQGESYSEDTLRNVRKYVHPDEQDICAVEMQIAKVKKVLEKKDEHTIYYRVVESDGDVRYKKMSFTYFDKAKGTVLISRTDVNDEFIREREKQQMLSDALRQAEQANRAKTDFLSKMSHEIRTPINGIKGMVELAEQTEDDKKRQQYLDKTMISTEHLIHLINDILDMSRIESGKLELKNSIVSIHEIVDKMDAIIGPLAEAKAITLNLSVPDDNLFVYCDGNRIEQVLINLLSNSVKYTGNGGMASLKVDVVKMSDNWAKVRWMVEDSGIGMSEEFLQKAFDPFEQAKTSSTKAGTGLGLAITKNLIELMGGTITVESVLGKGTTMSIMMEMECATEGDLVRFRALKNAKNVDFASLDLRGKKVLIVEDNMINQEIAVELMKHMGFITNTAGDGEEALEMFKKSEFGYYDLILMDIMMPKKDGLTAAKDIRGMLRPDAREVPIVAMTANAFVEDVEKTIKSGMNYHLSKPFDVKDLQEILIHLFGN